MSVTPLNTYGHTTYGTPGYPPQAWTQGYSHANSYTSTAPQNHVPRLSPPPPWPPPPPPPPPIDIGGEFGHGGGDSPLQTRTPALMHALERSRVRTRARMRTRLRPQKRTRKSIASISSPLVLMMPPPGPMVRAPPRAPPKAKKLASFCPQSCHTAPLECTTNPPISSAYHHDSL